MSTQSESSEASTQTPGKPFRTEPVPVRENSSSTEHPFTRLLEKVLGQHRENIAWTPRPSQYAVFYSGLEDSWWPHAFILVDLIALSIIAYSVLNGGAFLTNHPRFLPYSLIADLLTVAMYAAYQYRYRWFCNPLHRWHENGPGPILLAQALQTRFDLGQKAMHAFRDEQFRDGADCQDLWTIVSLINMYFDDIQGRSKKHLLLARVKRLIAWSRHPENVITPQYTDSLWNLHQVCQQLIQDTADFKSANAQYPKDHTKIAAIVARFAKAERTLGSVAGVLMFI